MTGGSQEFGTHWRNPLLPEKNIPHTGAILSGTAGPTGLYPLTQAREAESTVQEGSGEDKRQFVIFGLRRLLKTSPKRKCEIDTQRALAEIKIKFLYKKKHKQEIPKGQSNLRLCSGTFWFCSRTNCAVARGVTARWKRGF